MKVGERNYSAYTKDAIQLFGLMIRNSRKEKGMSVEELAERAGTSPSFVRRLEKGGAKCQLGVAFEVAFIAGVNLFVPEDSAMKARTVLKSEIKQAERVAALLPKAVHKAREEVKDDF